jgi:hypothetical protein
VIKVLCKFEVSAAFFCSRLWHIFGTVRNLYTEIMEAKSRILVWVDDVPSNNAVVVKLAKIAGSFVIPIYRS